MAFLPDPTEPASGGQLRRRIVEVRAALPGQVGRSWTGPLVIDVDVTLTGGRKPNKGKVDLHNLADESISYLERPNMIVEILAGEEVAGLLYRGQVQAKDGVRTTRQPGNRKTSIELLDGRVQWLSSAISRSWPPNVSDRQLLSDAIAAMGMSVGFISPSLPTRTYSLGYVWRGRPRDMLDDILFPTGARWSHANNVISILMPGDVLPGNSPLVSSGTGLIGGVKRKGKSIQFEAVFSPLYRPGGGVQVEAEDAKGVFRVTKVRQRPDSRGIIWRSNVDAIRP